MKEVTIVTLFVKVTEKKLYFETVTISVARYFFS